MDQDEKTHLRKLIEELTKRLWVLEEQEAGLGAACPPEIRTELATLRARIAELDQRLHAGSERMVDIAHEALITGWPTLRGWLTERRKAEQIRRRLEAKALDWGRLGHDSSGLLHAAELTEAERWLDSPDAADLGIDAALTALVRASRSALEAAEREHAARAAAEAEQQHQHELLQQRAGMISEVLNIFRALRTDRSIEEVLEQIAFSAIETVGFRSVAFNIVDPEDPTMMRIMAGAGISQAEFDRLHQAQFPVALAQRFLDPQFQLGRCFFVSAEAMSEITAGTDASAFTSNPVIDERDPGEWQIEDALFVPLYSTRGKLIGLMSVDDPFDRQRPTRRSVEPLEIFADQAAIALENAALLQDARSQAEQMTALYRVSAATVATLDLDDLLERVYREIVGYMGVPSLFFIASYDAPHNQMRFELFRKDDELLLSHHKLAQPKGGLTGWIIDTGELLHVRHWSVERDQLPVAPLPLDIEVSSWVGIPLRSQSQTIGVLSVQSFQPYAFSDRDVQFLSTLANQLAVALENVRLFRERERRIAELDMLNQIGRITSSTLDTEQMLEQISDCLAAFLTVDVFFGFVYHSDRNEISTLLRVSEGERIVERYNGPPPKGGLAERLVRSRQPLLFNDVRIEGDMNGVTASDFGTMGRAAASWLGVPLLLGEGEVVGALAVQSYTPNRYGERELSFLATAASQAATAIANARLFAERERRLREVSAIKDIGSAITATLDLQDALERLYRELGRVIDISTSFIGLYDAAENVLSYPIAFDRGKQVQFMPRPVGADGVNHWVISHHQPLLIGTDAEYQSFYEQLPPYEERIGLLEGPEESFLVVPIISSQDVLGVINIQSYEQHAYNQDDLRFVSTVANQAAIAINNARLFQERGRRIEELATFNEIGQQLSAVLQLDDLLEVIYRQTSRLLDTTNFYMALYDERSDEVTFPLFYEHGQRISESSRVRDDSLTAYVIRMREPLLVQGSDWAAQVVARGIRPVGAWSKSWLGVPMIAADQVVGVIGIQDYEQENAYTQDDIRLLSTIASWAAIALHNAYLLNETRQSESGQEVR